MPEDFKNIPEFRQSVQDMRQCLKEGIALTDTTLVTPYVEGGDLFINEYVNEIYPNSMFARGALRTDSSRAVFDRSFNDCMDRKQMKSK